MAHSGKARRSAAMRTGGQRGGLAGGGGVREAFDHLDEVVLGIEALGAAVGQKGVDERVVRAGFEAAENTQFFMPSLVGLIMFSTRLVSIPGALLEAVEEFGRPLIGGGTLFLSARFSSSVEELGTILAITSKMLDSETGLVRHES